MNKLYYIGLIFALIALSACSNKQIYNSVQQDQKLKCQKLPPSQYDECIEENSESYEDYQRDREEILKQESDQS